MTPRKYNLCCLQVYAAMFSRASLGVMLAHVFIHEPCIDTRKQNICAVYILHVVLCHCRELGAAISTIHVDQVRPICLQDFAEAMKTSKPSVNKSQLAAYEQWTHDFGSAG